MTTLPESFQKRRKKLLKTSGQPLIVVGAAENVQLSSDEAYEFRQEGHFLYLAGIEEPGWVLVIDGDKGEDWLIAPKRSGYSTGVWSSVTSDDEIKKAAAVSRVVDYAAGWERLGRLLKKHGRVGTLVPHPRTFAWHGMVANPAKKLLLQKLRRRMRNVKVTNVALDIARLRQTKDDFELQCIEQAVRITVDAINSVEKNISRYTSENEINADLTAHYLRAGSRHAFTPIVASGANATTLHYKKNNSPISKNSLIVIDTGASINNYSADISRTLMHGHASQRQKDIHEAVVHAQSAAYNLLKPGVSQREYEIEMVQVVGKELLQLGLISQILPKHVREFFPHATSHHLGLDTHDPADYTRPLEPGMVLTVEPGIYVPDEGIGVRIEDEVVITKNGNKIIK